MGERLRQEGYRGYFELDFLADAATGEIYLGELNPRVTGRQQHHERHRGRVRRHAAVPVPPAGVHGRRLRDRRRRAERALGAAGRTSTTGAQFILKQTDDAWSGSTEAPRVGHLADGRRRGDLVRRGATPTGTRWRTSTRRSTCGSPAPGQYRYPGADLGIIVTRGRFMDDEHELHGSRPPTGSTASRRSSRAYRSAAAAGRSGPSRSASRCSRSWMQMVPLHVPGDRGAGARPEVGGGLRGALAALPRVVPAGGRGGPAVIRDERARCSAPTCPSWCPPTSGVVELAGGGDLAARMLSLYRPPPYLAACSQGVWSRDGAPMLVRNYDYAPSRIEGVDLVDAAAERRVIGMSDCLWGLLDGMNDAGLAVSLTFGGRRVLGDGFGIPLVVRYLLETCDDVASAREVARPAAVLARAQPHAGRPRGRGRSPRTCRPTASRSSASSRGARTTRASSSGPSRRARPARSSASGASWTCWTTRRHDRGGLRRGVPARAAVQHGLRQRVRHALHGGVPADRGRRSDSILADAGVELGFERFKAGEHTEVLAEPTFATSAG